MIMLLEQARARHNGGAARVLAFNFGQFTYGRTVLSPQLKLKSADVRWMYVPESMSKRAVM